MLGIADPWVLAPYVLSILSALLCIGYGLFMWNKGDEPVVNEDVEWAKEEERENELL